jgi:hypothetical protein
MLLTSAATFALAAGGCEFDQHAVGTGRAQPVVHAVLSTAPELEEYVVFVERTLTGRIDTRVAVRDLDDPIVSGGGDPITGARVELVRLDGAVRTAVAFEDAAVRADRKGAGVYRFLNAACTPFFCPPNAQAIVRGGRYGLRVTLPGGTDRVEGETTVPLASLHPDTVPESYFDRERDTVRLSWPAAPGAHRYVLQVQTPYGPFQIFSDTNAITLTGGLRNFMAPRLPLVFTPGFLHRVQIAAVDASYYDYYRTGNDPFTGSGLLTRLRGGTGLFGSYAPIRRSSFEVITRQDEPVEGSFIGEVGTLDLYATGSGFMSGRLYRSGVRHGVLGVRSGNRMRLTVLRGVGVNDTLFNASAEVVADTVVLRDDAGRVTRLVRW